MSISRSANNMMKENNLVIYQNDNGAIGSLKIADLVSSFADTWFSLDAYDKSALPRSILVGAK